MCIKSEGKDIRFNYCRKLTCEKHTECYAEFSKVKLESERRNSEVPRIKMYSRKFKMIVKPESCLKHSEWKW